MRKVFTLNFLQPLLFSFIWILRSGSAYNSAITRTEIKTSGLGGKSFIGAAANNKFSNNLSNYHQHQNTRYRFLSLLSASNQQQQIEISNDELREDIESMKKSAMKRLEKLDEQINELKIINQHHQHQHSPSLLSSSLHSSSVALSNDKTKKEIEKASSFSASSSAAAIAIDRSSPSSNTESIATKNNNDQAANYLSSTIASIFGFMNDGESNNNDKVSTTTSDNKDQLIMVDPHVQASDRCLDDTRWKIVFKIEKDNKCKKKLERPLMVHTVFDFTSDPVLPKSEQDDDWLHWSGGRDPNASSGSTSEVVGKKIHIHEAYVGPTSLTVGQQKIHNINPLGGWRIVHGNGPLEKDILRFYFEISSDQDKKTEAPPSLLTPGRYYATCGYFSMKNHKNTEKYKDKLRNQLKFLKKKRDQLQQDQHQEQHHGGNNNSDQRGFLHPNIIVKNIMKNTNIVEMIKKDRELKKLDEEIHDLAKSIIVACNRDPCKSLLRVSKNGDIGLGKGQICKEIKKTKFEVLGKMELASIEYKK